MPPPQDLFDRVAKMIDCPALTIIVPCYNEEAVLPATARSLGALLVRLVEAKRIAASSHIYFVDDGSADETWASIRAARDASNHVAAIRLTRNCGHQNALIAGLLTAPGDCLVSIDADLQDDIGAIETMLDAAMAGAEIVFGVRSARRSDPFSKRFSAHLYYRLLQRLGVDIVFDHADFRLMTRNAIDALSRYNETNLFLRALIPQLGFKTAIVTYERAERQAGVTKYSWRKMLALAIEGITSFSTRPLQIVTIIGGFTSCLSIGLTIWAFLAAVVFRHVIPGWASTVIPIYLVCSVQLLSLGVIGEYVGKIYLETKRRPRFLIAETLPAA